MTMESSASKKILVVNPGGLSTKFALFDGTEKIASATIEHSTEELKKYASVPDQLPMRYEALMQFMQENNVSPSDLLALGVRGGPFHPLRSGVYRVNQRMIDDINEGNLQLMHASVLGPLIGFEFERKYSVPAFTVDPVSVDEMVPWARLSGLKELPRRSLSHALNTKYVARKVCNMRNVSYDEVNLVVAHLGSGISITAHRQGRMIDVSDAMNGGPFSPQRTGTLPVVDLVDLCFSGKYDHKQIKTFIMKEGGVYSYLGTSDGKELVRRATEGDEEAGLVLEAMTYQIAKEIGAMAVAAGLPIETIAITGSLAYSRVITLRIVERTKAIAPVEIFPGEFEAEALAEGAFAAATGKAEVLEYPALPIEQKFLI